MKPSQVSQVLVHYCIRCTLVYYVNCTVYATLLLPNFEVRRHIKAIPVVTLLRPAARRTSPNDVYKSSQPDEQWR